MRLINTRDPSDTVSFAEAAAGSLAQGGGLYLPERLPRFEDIEDLLAQPFAPRARTILGRLLGDEFEPAELDAIVGRAFDFPVPLVAVDRDTAALELFHGPSLAFKDFGARFLAQVLGTLARRAGASGAAVPTRTILTATSGDTGAAVAHAFHGLPGFRVAVLYPAGLVSPLQERQMATLGGNVRAFAVAGSFDDCQALVKALFGDPQACRDLGLTSANSINIARLLAQVLYYFEGVAAARPAAGGRPLVVAVPSGNFGNLCAGLIAARLGLPVAAFVAATNANRTVPDHLDGAPYRPRPSVPTLSNAMDVGAPNNWERIDALFASGRADLEGGAGVAVEGDGGGAARLRGTLRWGSKDDGETIEALRVLERLGYRADPHAAVAYAVLAEVRRPGEYGIFLGTAHPAKFKGVLEDALGVEVPLPAPLVEAALRPLRSEPLANDPAVLRRALAGVD